MPLLKPEVSRLMSAAGLRRSGPNDESGENLSVAEQLEDAGLSISQTLSSLRELRDMSDCESTKLRVNETVLKLHGLMNNNEQAQAPSITIVINDSSNNSQNPILLPRELHKLNEIVN